MAWKAHGLRGSDFEAAINMTNDIYKARGQALVQKIPTPITPMKMVKKGHITLSFFEQKSTVDYIGVARGTAVCFDAKECRGTTFPIKNVHAHQVDFMKDFEQQGGKAFFLLSFVDENTYYYLPLETFLVFWERAEKGGRKSFRMDELDPEWRLPEKASVPVPYIGMLAAAVNT